MAPAPALSSTPRHVNTRGRPTRTSSQRASSDERHPVTEPPLKKRRYIPGSLGGGGRSIASVEKRASMMLNQPIEEIATEPRPRVRRESSTVDTPTAISARPRRESRRDRNSARPRFSSAAAAAAAVANGDGFKPREERGWEEFHEDLDIEAVFPVFGSHEVDGTKNRGARDPETPHSENGITSTIGQEITPYVNGSGRQTPQSRLEIFSSASPAFTPKRRPGRPPRRVDAMLKGIGISPEVPKIIPPPGFNPREKLTLPKPSFRPLQPFERFKQQEESVDQSMINVGYQEREVWFRPTSIIRVTEGNIEDDLLAQTRASQKDDGTGIGPSSVGRVEYDMDEQDTYWLEAQNELRRQDGIPEVRPWVFEVMMTKIEKEWHALEKRIPKPNPKPPQTHRPRSSSAAAVNGELATHGEEQDTKCAICDDGDCENTNAIVFCDGCDLAVHQECYGVPFIPEGQWLCRKCQLIGRGTPTCIFCPNTDGAFKQTNASRWAHLLCAIWIPEVSIGNPTFMEPVMEVEKVPKQRWKLTCYICRQKMGACIQCGNKNCYIAFHVSCARRARLFLKMKSTHGSPATLDASVLKAFCDKHVPADWRREYDVDRAIVEAMDYYRHTMRGRLWADSQQAALTAVPPPLQDPLDDAVNTEDFISNPKITLKFGNKTIARPHPPKIVWKLPSGAPVIPKSLYDSIESSLPRFQIQKRKDFAAEVCKYWTLKREARRGAALLKRLQLQLETFNSMEIPRRNFVGMGAAGGLRLQRRIEFADTLKEELEKLTKTWALVVERERQKQEDASNMKRLVETVYFPMKLILSPIIHIALANDTTGAFYNELTRLQVKIDEYGYDSVLDFAIDFAEVISQGLSSPRLANESEAATPNGHTSPSKQRTNHLKAVKLSAKRITRAVQAPLEEAVHQHCDLTKADSRDDLGGLQAILEGALLARSQPTEVTELSAEKNKDGSHSNGLTNEVSHINDAKSTENGSPSTTLPETPQKTKNHARGSLRRRRTGTGSEERPLVNGRINGASHHSNDTDRDSSAIVNGQTQKGGIPWYMEDFAPQGTTIQDDEILTNGHAEIGAEDTDTVEAVEGDAEAETNGVNGHGPKAPVSNKKKASTKKRKRGWSVR